MIKQGIALTRDNLNAAFLSKTALGTQILSGSLNILGNLTIAGSISAGSITAASFTGTFWGDGSGITSLSATNISAGTLADARLSTNVDLLNTAQTFTANKTFSASANLYFAGGTTYYINTAGTAYLNGLTAVGATTFNNNVTVAGGKYITMSSSGSAAPTGSTISSGSKIILYANNYGIGIEPNAVWYDSAQSHKFYSNSGSTSTLRFQISDTGVTSSVPMTVTAITATGSTTLADLDVQGEFKATASNEFPDPYMARGDVGGWTGAASTLIVSYVAGQTPTSVSAFGALQLFGNSSNTDGYIYYDNYFDVGPNEWITFSAHVFATAVNVSHDLFIIWYDSAKTMLGSSALKNTANTATAWTRYFVTGQAPSNARYFRVRVDNNTASSTLYFTGFQVERGRTLTGFKPYDGSNQSDVKAGGVIIAGQTLGSSFGEGILNLWNNGGTEGRISSKSNYGIYLKYGSNEVGIGNSSSTIKINGTTTITGQTVINGWTTIQGNNSGNIEFNYSSTGSMFLSHGTGQISFRTWNGTSYTVHSIINELGNWGVGTNTPTTGYRLDVNGSARFNGKLMLNNTGIEKVNYLYFDYNGTYGTNSQHGITSMSTDSLWINSMNNVTINLDSNNNNSSSMLLVASGATGDTGSMLFMIQDTDITSTIPIYVASGAAVKSLAVDNYTNIQMSSHSSATWLRNQGGQWAFQAGSEAERWTNTFSIYQPTVLEANGGGNNTYIEIGQRNANIANGTYRGLRIVKYVSNTVVDGDFSAGATAISGALTAGSTLSVTGTSTFTGAATFNNGIVINKSATHLTLQEAGVSEWHFESVGTALRIVETGVATRLQIASGGAGTYTGTMTFSSTVSAPVYQLTAATSSGISFWGTNSTSYRIHMSTTGDATYGGSVAGAGTSDYNMYFRMQGGGTNRGFVFHANSGPVVQIEASGKVNTLGGVRVSNKYEITYNSTEDSLDFVYG